MLIILKTNNFHESRVLFKAD